jgi:hypothetical protein
MEVTGKIILALKEIGGESKATGRPWKKREYVLETFESYPKKIFFDFFGDKASTSKAANTTVAGIPASVVGRLKRLMKARLLQ